MNNREAMQKAFEAWASDYSGEFDFSTTPHGTYIDHPTYCAFIGFRAALASQKQQTELVAWGYAWECKSVGDWRIEKLGEGCIPPKDTIALYTAPEGDKE